VRLPLFDDIGETSLWTYEELAFRRGYRAVAASTKRGGGLWQAPWLRRVILPVAVDLSGIDDSKKLSAPKRDHLYGLIYDRALAIGIGVADHVCVDRINILQATLTAMADAVNQLSVPADFLLIDGISIIPLNLPQRTIKKGDSASISIAAASVIAKVTRDRMMMEYDQQYPGYGFAEHKGYGCASHLSAIATLGPCPIHRKTFRGVKEHVSLQ